MLLVDSNSKGNSCFFPLVTAGIFTSAQHNSTLSVMLKPLSANTMSPGKSVFKRPQFTVKCLSDTRPQYPHDKNEIAPCGVIPIKYFTVLWCCNYSMFQHELLYLLVGQWISQNSQ